MFRSLFKKKNDTGPSPEGLESVVRAIRELLPEEQKSTSLSMDTKLNELGFDSIQYINLIFQLEQNSTKSLEDIAAEMDLSEINSIGDIVQLMGRLK